MGENTIDYGTWECPTSWREVTLKQYQEIERYYSDKDKRTDVRDVVHILCNKTVDEVNALPIEFFEVIIGKLSFIETKPDEEESRNWVEINGERYTVRTESKLRVGEYIASDSALKGDSHNYAAILAILCRKDGEVYDSRFENEVLEERIRMWESVPVVDVLPLISFFLAVYITLQMPIQLSSRAREALDLTRSNIETLQRSGEISRRSMRSAMKRLQKLERYINTI